MNIPTAMAARPGSSMIRSSEKRYVAMIVITPMPMRANITGAYHGGDGRPAGCLAGFFDWVGPGLVALRFLETGIPAGYPLASASACRSTGEGGRAANFGV